MGAGITELSESKIEYLYVLKSSTFFLDSNLFETNVFHFATIMSWISSSIAPVTFQNSRDRYFEFFINFKIYPFWGGKTVRVMEIIGIYFA